MCENKAMGYGLEATDHLKSSTLTLSIPVAALELPMVQKVCGLMSFHFDKPLAEAKKRNRAHVEIVLESVDWEWDEDTVELTDQDGEEHRIETKKRLFIDDGKVNNMSRRQHRLMMDLKSLGIPHDIELFDSIELSTTVERSKLNADQPTGDAIGCSPIETPSFETLAKIAHKCTSIESFQEFIRDYELPEFNIVDEAKSYNARLESDPQWAAFTNASAGIISIDRSRRSYFGSGSPLWSPEISTWFQTLYDGKTPMDRFAKSLPISLPLTLEFAEEAFKQNPPDLAVAGTCLSAYCESRARMFKPNLKDFSAVDVKTAIFIGNCLEKAPEIYEQLSDEAKQIFQADIKTEKGITEEQFALAEASWLRAQSIRSAPHARASVKRQTL